MDDGEPAKLFVLIVTDHDRGVCSVEGPTCRETLRRLVVSR